MQSTKQQTLYDQITDRVLNALESGVERWQQPWTTRAPINAVTERPYRGINILLLALTAAERNYVSSGWVTYRAAAAAGGHVRRGERATTIAWWERRTARIEENTIDPLESSEPEARSRWLTRSYAVFNLDQCDGLESLRMRSIAHEEGFERIAECQRAVSSSGARIEHGAGAAYYCPATDTISLPEAEHFTSSEAYYATLFHELTHWSGAPSRLNRQITGRFGDAAYAFEELVAELGAAFLCGRFAIDHVSQAAAYVQSWIRVLRNDNRAIVTAARLATQAADYLSPPAPEETARERAETLMAASNPIESSR
jgi:antirestriction protein ArdC